MGKSSLQASCWLLPGLTLLVITGGSSAGQTGSSAPSRTSRWWSQIEPIEKSLDNGRWKYARGRTIKLTKTILEEGWNDRELDEI